MPSCDHKGWRLWLSNWLSWCTYCGKDEQHVGEVILGRKHKLGDVVDSMDAGPNSDRPASVSGVETVRPVTVYLAHPFKSADVGLRVQGLLEAAGIGVINPFDRPDQVEFDYVMANGGVFTEEQSDRIVRGDLSKVEQAATVVAVLTGVPSIGTYMEIYHNAVLLNRATFSLILDEFSKNHPWIQRLTRRHYNVESLIEDLLRWPNS